MSVTHPPLRAAAGQSAAESNRLLRRYAATGDPATLDELVRRFRPLARKLALRYARGSEPIEDLEQVACLGLVKAVKGFDPGRGFAFTSFAVPTILGELKRSFRNTAWSVHVPRAIQERVADVRRVSEEHSAHHGHAPTPAQIAERLGCDEELVVEALDAGRTLSPVSLDGPQRGLDDEEGGALLDALGDVDAGYERVMDRSAIEAALPTLTGAQRRVIELRFGQELKQSEIAERIGCSQMQVSRLLRLGMDRLSHVAQHQSRAR